MIRSAILALCALLRLAAAAAAQSEPLAAYSDALGHFKAVLAERRAQIASHQPLPNLPGQALYLARNATISTYKDLTDAMPSRIGRPNKFGIPPAYFDADNEGLIDEYLAVFNAMQAAPASAQKSETPFKDVYDLSTAIARAKGLDAANAEIAGRIGLGIFFAETNGNQNMGNARSNTYKGSYQTGTTEDQNGRKKWAAIRPAIAAFDPALIARDDREEARVGGGDHRFNHWTAVRDGLMNAHAELFRQIPTIAKALPNPIDQMKLFELIQIIPVADQVGAGVGQSRQLPDFRPDHHEVSAQQQRLHLRPRRPRQDLGDVPRNPRRDVAVRRQIPPGDRAIERDQGAEAGVSGRPHSRSSSPGSLDSGDPDSGAQHSDIDSAGWPGQARP